MVIGLIGHRCFDKGIHFFAFKFSVPTICIVPVVERTNIAQQLSQKSIFIRIHFFSEGKAFIIVDAGKTALSLITLALCQKIMILEGIFHVGMTGIDILQFTAHHLGIGDITVIKRGLCIQYIKSRPVFSTDCHLFGGDFIIENPQIINCLLNGNRLNHIVNDEQIILKIRHDRIKAFHDIDIGLHILYVPFQHIVQIFNFSHQRNPSCLCISRNHISLVIIG